MSPLSLPTAIEFHAAPADRYAPILTPEAIDFLVTLQREFNPRRKQLLAARVTRQKPHSTPARRPTSSPKPQPSAPPPGKSLPSPPTCKTAA